MDVDRENQLFAFDGVDCQALDLPTGYTWPIRDAEGLIELVEQKRRQNDAFDPSFTSVLADRRKALEIQARDRQTLDCIDNVLSRVIASALDEEIRGL